MNHLSAKKKKELQAMEHGVSDTKYDNLGAGWRMECLCGEITSAWETISGCATELEDHFVEMGLTRAGRRIAK